MMYALRWVMGLFTNNGVFHQYYSDPWEGPARTCRPSCKKCFNESLENTPLAKALK